MFIAMNRFQIIKGEEKEFERIWSERETHLGEVPGFIEFNLLRGPEMEGYTLYASHTTWVTQAQFVDWTKSEAFRKAHAQAGNSRKEIYMGPPQFEGFESVQYFAVDEK